MLFILQVSILSEQFYFGTLNLTQLNLVLLTLKTKDLQ